MATDITYPAYKPYGMHIQEYIYIVAPLVPLTEPEHLLIKTLRTRGLPALRPSPVAQMLLFVCRFLFCSELPKQFVACATLSVRTNRLTVHRSGGAVISSLKYGPPGLLPLTAGAGEVDIYLLALRPPRPPRCYIPPFYFPDGGVLSPAHPSADTSGKPGSSHKLLNL